jgi:hypothetical protein
MSRRSVPSILLACVLVVLLAPAAALAETLSVLTYNVAGLPLGLSGSNPEVNTVQISPRLNAYDLVVVQEDFAFHEELTSQLLHPYISIKDTRDAEPLLDLGIELGLGDGLNTFSFSPFADFTRVTWDVCHGLFTDGSDCLAVKGFTYARHELATGVFVDVYNLHADAGSSAGDLEARRTQLRQLADFVLEHSAGEAVIVLGDFNSRYTRQGDILPELLATLDLEDVWIELSRGGELPAIGGPLRDCEADFAGPGCERVDKILYRSGQNVKLVAIDHDVPMDWVDAQGVQLSDHEPVSATFQIHFVPGPPPALACRPPHAPPLLPNLRSAHGKPRHTGIGADRSGQTDPWQRAACDPARAAAPR